MKSLLSCFERPAILLLLHLEVFEVIFRIQMKPVVYQQGKQVSLNRKMTENESLEKRFPNRNQSSIYRERNTILLIWHMRNALKVDGYKAFDELNGTRQTTCTGTQTC